MNQVQKLATERPTETIPIGIGAALVLVLSRFLNGDAELAGALITIAFSLLPALITFINVQIKKRGTYGPVTK